ncbi:MAG: DNA-directed RNA polymerase subunit omega [bacterium]|nr:DNA-directed RNA polymerase subunit omega [bacterium]
MTLISIEDLLKNVKNRYELVILASKRTKQLMDGTTPFVEDRPGKKLNVMALEEIKEGLVIPQREVMEDRK